MQTVNTTAELLTVWEANGAVSKNATPDQANNRVAATFSDDYRIEFTVSFSGDTNADTWRFMVYTGTIGATAVNNNISLRRKVSANDVGAATFHGDTHLTAGQVVEVYLLNDVGDHVITVLAATLSLQPAG